MKKILSERAFIAYHDDFKDDFLLKRIANDEHLSKWIDLPTHTNVVTVFDTFMHDGKQFQLTEITNSGNMY